MGFNIQRPPYFKKFIVSFILGTIIFLLVFLLGYSVSYYKLQDTVTAQEDLRYQLLSVQVEEELLGNSCSDFDPLRFSEERIRIGGIIAVLEERLGKTDSRVLEQKKTYSIIEAKHFIYIRTHNENCEDKVPVVLFFYSNDRLYKTEASKIGYMLDTLNNKRQDMMVYSFDYDLDSSLIDLLKEKYKVNAPNTLVINEKTPLNVFNSMSDIENLL